MTLKLCGFASSNYYNKVKLQLLEKGVLFEEVLAWTGHTDPLTREASPLGKVPYLQTPNGPVCESSACCEYIEASYPEHALIPADPYAAAKVRELVIFLDLHLELVARELFPQAYFGGSVSESVQKRCHKLLSRGAAGLAKLAKFSPYIAGPDFTLADCVAIVHLPVVAGACKAIYNEDLLAALPWREYLQRMSERPTVQRVVADRKANQEAFMAYVRGDSPKA